jgi:hypothetical protein
MKELTMAELSAGVRALVGRMESNPNEFYGEADKWRFMFSSNFRDVLTEPEKGALHEALKEVRRKEFDEKVMRELLKDNMENQIKEGYYTSPQIGSGAGGVLGVSNGGTGFNQAQAKAEFLRIRTDGVDANRYNLMDSNTITKTGTTSLRLGEQTLSEEDIKRMKEASTSPSFFK